MKWKILGGVLIALPLIAWSALMIWRSGCLAFFASVAAIAVFISSVVWGISLLFGKED